MTRPEWGAGRGRRAPGDEHLAPVSYLPWAAPEPDDGPKDHAEPGTPGESTTPDESGGLEDAPRLRTARWRGDADDVPPARGASRRSRFADDEPFPAIPPAGDGAFPAIPPAGDGAFPVAAGAAGADTSSPAAAPAAAETGPERDARIDRIVVSKLRRASLSVAEVRAVLVEHGLDDVEVEEWLERYRRLGYLDDARMAEQLVHTQQRRRGKGSGAILQELSRRGVDPEAARQAIAAIDEDDEFEHALGIAVKRAGQLRGLDRVTSERRLSAFLQRRGFGSELTRRVVREALDPSASGRDS